MNNGTGKNASHWCGGPIKKSCSNCKKTFYVNKAKANERKNCSLKCQYSWRSKNLVKDKSPRWKGGIVNNWGYTYIHSPEHPFKNAASKVAEHRLIMEKHLGRYLRKDETVHHINHIKNDNRIENLELMSKKEHLTHHAKLTNNYVGKNIHLFKPPLS